MALARSRRLGVVMVVVSRGRTAAPDRRAAHCPIDTRRCRVWRRNILVRAAPCVLGAERVDAARPEARERADARSRRSCARIRPCGVLGATAVAGVPSSGADAVHAGDGFPQLARQGEDRAMWRLLTAFLMSCPLWFLLPGSGMAQTTIPSRVQVNHDLPLVTHPGRTVMFDIAISRPAGSGDGGFYGSFVDTSVTTPAQRKVGIAAIDAWCAQRLPGDGVVLPHPGTIGWMRILSVADGTTAICRMRLSARPDASPGTYAVAFNGEVLQILVTVPGAHPIPAGGHTPWLLALLLASIAAWRMRPR